MYFLFHHLTPLIMPHINWYKYRQELRLIIKQKQVSDIKKLISQITQTSIQQNPIVKMQRDQIKNLEQQQNKFEKPTPVPFPGFSTEGLESLLKQLRGFGTVEDVGRPYRKRINPVRKSNPVRKFGKEGTKKGELYSPSGLTLYRNESIYIPDTFNSRIQIFSTAGKFIAEFGKGQLSRPYSIALYDKWVFVSDYFLSVIYKFEITNNKFVCQSAKGVLNVPYGITVDINGEVLVADCDNNRIAVLNSELKFVREIGKGKLKNPRDVKIHNNNIFVADNNEINNIHIFTKTGDIIRSFIKLEKCVF